MKLLREYDSLTAIRFRGILLTETFLGGRMERSRFYFAGRALEGLPGHEAAWGLLEQLYQDVTGELLPAVARTERGKPLFMDSPWHFSLTHTRRHAFCVLSLRPVGVDAEELDREIDLRLADKILSPGERAQYDAAPDKPRALLTFWVLKEAASKCSGEGLRGYPNRTAFSLTDSRVTEQDDCLVAVVTEDEFH